MAGGLFTTEPLGKPQGQARDPGMAYKVCGKCPWTPLGKIILVLKKGHRKNMFFFQTRIISRSNVLFFVGGLELKPTLR